MNGSEVLPAGPRAYSQDNRFIQLDVVTSNFSNDGPRHLVFSLNNDIYVLPAAFYLGACYAEGGRTDEAVGAWQTALVTEADARIVYDVLADALLRLEDAEQTIQVLGEAQGRWPEDEGFLPRQAVAEAMLGHRAEALATLKRYLEKHRTDTEAAALGIRLIYESRAAGQAITSPESDRETAATFGDWYRSGGGQNLALVDRWLTFIAKK
jgi:tetratricopeptide (TPR) repeat protein